VRARAISNSTASFTDAPARCGKTSGAFAAARVFSEFQSTGAAGRFAAVLRGARDAARLRAAGRFAAALRDGARFAAFFGAVFRFAGVCFGRPRAAFLVPAFFFATCFTALSRAAFAF